jgi:hypothetical protein
MRTIAGLLILVLAPAAAHAQAVDADGGNAAVRILHDVAIDYRNFLSLETAETLAIGGFGAGAMHGADEAIATHVHDTDPAALPGGETYGSQYLHLPVAVAWWVVAGAAGSSRHAATGRDLLRAQIAAVSWTYGIKIPVGRTRPNGDPHSFPSGHASTSFATAAVLQRHYGWKAGLPAFLAAAYTGVSRVNANQHWASDVIFGSAVGIASGHTATVRLRGASVSVAPMAVPGGGGVRIAATR